MLWQIVKKQGLTLIRNPQQLFLLIGLPIILITILSIALGGFMSGKAMTIDVKVAIIENEDEEVQVERFIAGIENSGLPDEAVQTIISGITQFTPIYTLKEEVFGELSDLVQLDIVTPSEKNKILADDSYAALIEVPNNFTYDILQKVYLNNDDNTSLQFYVNDDKYLGSKITEEILKEYEEQLSLITYASKNKIDIENLMIDPESIVSYTRSYHEESEPVTSKGYYTVAMAVMNVLFIASTIGSYAFREKQSNVFNRIIVSDVSQWIYFIGIFISTAIFAFIQLLIIFGASWIIFGIVWENFTAFIMITIGLSCAVGGVGVLLTAISYRLNTEVLINYFQSLIISVLAFLGGSFFPVGDFSKLVRVIGDLTPNGAGMSAYLMILRGSEISNITDYLLYLGLFSVILIIIAIISFPKRGQIQ